MTAPADDDKNRLKALVESIVDRLMEHFESALIICSRGNRHTVIEAGNVFACRKLGEMYAEGDLMDTDGDDTAKV